MKDSPSEDPSYYMRLLVDRVPTMLAYWDRNLICRFANRAYEAWFGVDPDRLLGTSIRELLGQRGEPRLHGQGARRRATGLRAHQSGSGRGPGGVERGAWSVERGAHSLAEHFSRSTQMCGTDSCKSPA